MVGKKREDEGFVVHTLESGEELLRHIPGLLTRLMTCLCTKRAMRAISAYSFCESPMPIGLAGKPSDSSSDEMMVIVISFRERLALNTTFSLKPSRGDREPKHSKTSSNGKSNSGKPKSKYSRH